MHFATCPKQGREMEAFVLHRVGFLAYSCPKQGQDFQPSMAPLYPNMGQVRLIKNWRPISLINLDTKIVSKALAKQLDLLQPKCVCES